MTRYLLVGGTFNDEGGRASGYVRKLAEALKREMPGDWEAYNGGWWSDLAADLDERIRQADVLFWFPDIPNDKEKLVSGLKAINPTMMFVTSKNNIAEQDRHYTRLDLVARALQSKSNLLLEIKRQGDVFVATIIDPLGNDFAVEEASLDKVARALARRLYELMSFSRVSSHSVAEVMPLPQDGELDGFFDLVRAYAERFHALTHAVHQERLIGNVSFRCERGFPSFRQDGEIIYVSRRNIDKRHIDREGFVAVNGERVDTVEYYGEVKPSVDTPVQLGLYQRYPNVRFMLHSHTYIEGAPFTEGMTPCGAIEEIDEIARLFPDPNATDFFVNLKGHGSLALVSDWRKLRDIPYVARSVYDDVMRDEVHAHYQEPGFTAKSERTDRLLDA